MGRRTLSREQRLVSFEKGRRKKDKWCHPKAWTHSGATYEAFSQVGMVMRKDARETRRQLDAVAALSLALRKHSGEACRAWAMMHPFQQKVTKWVLLEDEIDCTVWTVARGPRPDGSVLVARPQGGTVEALVSRGHETAEQADAAEQRCS